MATKEQRAEFAQIREIVKSCGVDFYQYYTDKNLGHHRMKFMSKGDWDAVYSGTGSQIRYNRRQAVKKIRAALKKKNIDVQYCDFEIREIYDGGLRHQLIIRVQ